MKQYQKLIIRYFLVKLMLNWAQDSDHFPVLFSDLYYYTSMDYEDDPDEADEGGECHDRDLEEEGHWGCQFNSIY